MLSKIKTKLKNQTEIVALSLLILITIISTTYYNNNKKKIYNNYKNTIHNLYFKKTINHFFDNLEPKFKNIKHKISAGETFDTILENYSINKIESYEKSFSSPYIAASRGYIDEVILPSNTRLKVANALRVLRKKKLENPWKKHDNIPL